MGKGNNDPGIKPEDRDEARELAALAFLWELLGAAEKQLDFLTWRRKGGPEAVDFLDAVGKGRQHPLLEKCKELVAHNRSAPSPLDLETRKLVVLMVEALRRAGLGEGIARERAAEAVNPIYPTTKEAIRGWRSAYPKIIPDEEKRVAGAINRYGVDHANIIGWFVGLIRLKVDPAASLTARRVLIRKK